MTTRKRRLKPWHWGSIAATVLLGLPLLWFLLAYAGLPRLWSHHEHKKIGARDQLTSYTGQDIPGDPINLHIHGNGNQIIAAYQHAGWSLADTVSLVSGLRIGWSVIAFQPYPKAPVSPLFVNDKVQSFALEIDTGKSADKRHHVRFWQIGPDDYLAAATFDRGVGLSLFTLQITHHIGPAIDAERALSGQVLAACGAQAGPPESMRLRPAPVHRNGGGDKYQTDGRIAVFTLTGPACRPNPPQAG